MVTIAIGLGLLGVIFGSFVNAFVWRLHEQAKLKKAGDTESGKKKPKKQGATRSSDLTSHDLSITKGRSMCPNCHHTLAAKDLVPVLSWVWLRGKCRYCGKPIPDSPVIEVLTGVLFAVSYVSWPHDFQGVGLLQLAFWLLYVVVFMALAVYDLRWFLLPDKVVFPLVGAALVEVVAVAVWQHSLTALWQPLTSAAIIFGLFYALFQVSKGAWIGGGDVKLALALGLIVGTPVNAFLVIFFASLLGTLASVPLLVRGKKGLKMHIPFGPYLLLATFLVGLYGARVVEWYTRLFMPGA